MQFNRRELLSVSSSTFALMGFTEILSSLIVGGNQPVRAAPRSDLSSYDAMGLAELIRTKQIAPGDAVEDTIRKIEAVNPTLNAVIYKTYDRARQRTVEGVGNGPFAGVPFLVKDNATIAPIAPEANRTVTSIGDRMWLRASGAITRRFSAGQKARKL
jgi:hypothetical protein